MESLVIFVHVIAAVAITGLVLMQHGKGADLGASFGSGSSQTMFGPVGSGNVLTKSTTILAIVFFLTSLGLAVIARQQADLSIADTSLLANPDQLAMEADDPPAEGEALVVEAATAEGDVPVVEETPASDGDVPVVIEAVAADGEAQAEPAVEISTTEGDAPVVAETPASDEDVPVVIEAGAADEEAEEAQAEPAVEISTTEGDAPVVAETPASDGDVPVVVEAVEEAADE